MGSPRSAQVSRSTGVNDGDGHRRQVANLDTHGLAFDTTAGVFVIYSTVVPNASPSEATGNFYSQVPAGGGFGVGVFNLVPAPLPAALPLFATGLSALGLLGWRRKRTARSVTT